MIVLSWLATKSKELKIFGTNRISKIEELILQCKWLHIRYKANAVDPISRRLFPKLLECKIHHDGSEFLLIPEVQWPNFITSTVPPEQLPDYKLKMQCILHTHEGYDMEDILR